MNRLKHLIAAVTLIGLSAFGTAALASTVSDPLPQTAACASDSSM